MRLIISSIGLATLVAFAGNARADDPIKLKLSIEPAANSAELTQLMRQNTVRVALQRHRLWEEAAETEQLREMKQVRERKQHRAKKSDGEAKGKGKDIATTDDVSMPSDDVSESSEDKKQTRTRERAENREHKGDATEVGATAAKEQLRLRQILRKDRVSGEDALADKLQNRLREQKRVKKQGKKQQKKQHQSGKQQRRKGSGR